MGAVAVMGGSRLWADDDWGPGQARGGEPTLDDLIVDAWEGLTACATVACPLCGGAMEREATTERRRLGQAAHVIGRKGGMCRSCGTALT